MNPIAYHFNCPDWRLKIDYLMDILKSKITYFHKGNHKLEILICNSKIEPDITQQSLEILNYPYIWLGKGIDWNYNTIKIRLFLDYLKKSNSKYVMGLDGSDVVVIDNPEIILERYLKYYKDKKLVFASELTSFPKYYKWQEEVFSKDAKVSKTNLGSSELYRYNWPSNKLENNKYCFLNAGCWIGEREYVIKFFESIEKYIGMKSEQTYVQEAFANTFPNTWIDNKCILFQCMVCCDESEIKHMLNKEDILICKENYKSKFKIMKNEKWNYFIFIIFIIFGSLLSKFLFDYIS